MSGRGRAARGPPRDLLRGLQGLLAIATSKGDFSADQVVVASGGYHLPIIPRMAERLPQSVTQLHSEQYRNAQSLPEGTVLVVGSGQSGAQIAEDLHLAGRQVLRGRRGFQIEEIFSPTAAQRKFPVERIQPNRRLLAWKCQPRALHLRPRSSNPQQPSCRPHPVLRTPMRTNRHLRHQNK